MDKILIIDDDQKNIFALTAVLRSRGYSTVSALSAEEGLDLLDTSSGIRIVLLDMMMPDIDGYEMLSRIRKSEVYWNLPVVAVTAQAMPGDKEKCIAAGADEYVSKPVDIDRLVSLLNEYLKPA
ncbi:MAG: response regulator [Chitinophagaceae bacterium]|nr:MAG: response regulator [Chitinophagaceae bacterium]